MDFDFLTISQIKNGDRQAGERLIRKYYPEILRYCYLHVSCRDDAEDLTQETFVRFFASLGRYEYHGKTKNYLYTIAANLCRDHYKKIRDLPLEDLPEQSAESIPEVEIRLDISAALEQLSMDLREVTILYYFRQRSQKEIAAILGISPTLVRRRLKRATQQLRILLGKEEE